jgi:hypothetical protein
MTKALLSISTAALLEAPFFVLDGPDGPLSCQWTSYKDGKATSQEFEIVCPERPDKMGGLFGLYDAHKDEFRMRPEVKPHTYEAVDGGCQDLDWRGDLNDVMDTGRDWDMGPDGRLVISDPEEPAGDPVDAVDETPSSLPLAA